MSAVAPFSHRFSGPWTDEELRSRIAVTVEPLTGLSNLGPDTAASRLESFFKTLVVPTTQMISIVRQMIERASAYCDCAYRDEVAVKALIYGSGSTIEAHTRQATCLTGLAGVGKSVLFDAFWRVFGRTEFVEMPGHARLELNACWRMTIRGGASFAQLIQPHFRNQSSIAPSKALGFAVSEAAAQGVALILADEFQFITSGSANTMMANLLFQLAQVGPPVLYACNFSMLHALWRRPQQDRDRLLLSPIILHPEPIGEDWTTTMEACLTVSEEFSSLKNSPDIQLMHDYTFGIKRSLRSLLVLAYLEMRNDKQSKVTRQHLTAAFCSPEYGAMREDVENLVMSAVSPSLRRKDLTCPFAGANVNSSPKGKEVDHPAAQANANNSTRAAQLSMLNPELRELLTALEDQALPANPPKTRTHRRIPASARNLLGGAERFASRDKKDR